MIRVSASYGYCERLTQRVAGNFYPAMLLLPRAQRRAMYALYAFSRLTDDLSDSDAPDAEKDKSLCSWREDLAATLAGEDRHPALPALRQAVQTFSIPTKHLFDIIEGCRLDVVQHRFATFDELYHYCTLVASAVGQACIHIWGFRGDRAPQYAEWAGVALQLTNILRDLGEDRARGRVYLPQEDLKRFGCCTDTICGGPTEPSFRALMQFEVERTQQYYEWAKALDGCLAPAGRAIFRVIFDTYHALLERIERVNHDVFSERIRLSLPHKLGLAVRALPLRWGWSLG
ncbi:MAG: phytoene/squalene synthase family protein [Gemmataceae bacterium]